jgi:hypothetical protein
MIANVIGEEFGLDSQTRPERQRRELWPVADAPA